MNFITKTIPIWTVLTTIVFFADIAAAIEFSPAEKAKLAAGTTVKKPLPNSGKKGFYGGSGFTLVDAPVDVVWAAVQDWGSYHKMFPATVSVKEVSRKGSRSLIKMNLGHSLVTLEYYVDVKKDEKKKIMSFSLVENRPHDIVASKGYWRLFPQKDGRTLIAYVVTAQVPMGIINLIKPEVAAKIERNLVGAPNDLKKWILSPKGNKYFTMTARN